MFRVDGDASANDLLQGGRSSGEIHTKLLRHGLNVSFVFLCEFCACELFRRRESIF